MRTGTANQQTASGQNESKLAKRQSLLRAPKLACAQLPRHGPCPGPETAARLTSSNREPVINAPGDVWCRPQVLHLNHCAYSASALKHSQSDHPDPTSRICLVGNAVLYDAFSQSPVPLLPPSRRPVVTAHDIWRVSPSGPSRRDPKTRSGPALYECSHALASSPPLVASSTDKRIDATTGLGNQNLTIVRDKKMLRRSGNCHFWRQ